MWMHHARLTDFLQWLDTRAHDTIKDTKKHFPECKERILATPLNTSPPQNAPAWTISNEWLKSKIWLLFLFRSCMLFKNSYRERGCGSFTGLRAEHCKLGLLFRIPGWNLQTGQVFFITSLVFFILSYRIINIAIIFKFHLLIHLVKLEFINSHDKLFVI